jgi:hypothetical protein
LGKSKEIPSTRKVAAEEAFCRSAPAFLKQFIGENILLPIESSLNMIVGCPGLRAVLFLSDTWRDLEIFAYARD